MYTRCALRALIKFVLFMFNFRNCTIIESCTCPMADVFLPSRIFFVLLCFSLRETIDRSLGRLYLTQFVCKLLTWIFFCNVGMLRRFAVVTTRVLYYNLNPSCVILPADLVNDELVPSKVWEVTKLLLSIRSCEIWSTMLLELYYSRT